MVSVPRGNRYATLMRATRKDASGDVTLNIPDLPPGIAMQAADTSQSEFPVIFEASSDAAISGKFCHIAASLSDSGKLVDAPARFTQRIDLVRVPTLQAIYYSTDVHELAVAVAKEAPFKLHLEQPKAPIVQGGEMSLRVTAERSPGFTAPIHLRILFLPPGITALAPLDMSGSEIAYPIEAKGDAQVHDWKTCVIGSADVNGDLWMSSELIDLNVASAYLAGSARRTAVERGKTSVVIFTLQTVTPFKGAAKATLRGLPPRVTAQEAEIHSGDQTVSFQLTADQAAPLGNYSTLFISALIHVGDHDIYQTVGRGGVLRIDAPGTAIPAKKAKSN